MRGCGLRIGEALAVSEKDILPGVLRASGQVLDALPPRLGPLSRGSAKDLAEPGPGSVLVLDVEVGTANGSGQLRLLPRELEPRGELRGDFHPFG